MPPAAPYSIARYRIATGDVLLFQRNPGSLISRFICWWTQSTYSHAGLAAWLSIADVERLFVIEATVPLVRIYPVSLYVQKRGEHIDWYAVDALRVHRERVAAFALDKVGFPYAGAWQFLLSFLAPLRWLARKWGRDVNRPLDQRHYFCSQLVADAIQHGLNNTEQVDPIIPVLTSPGMLEFSQYLKRMGTIRPDDT